MAEARRWNPRYVAYATAHGREPEDMLTHDREAWPGGQMVGFMLWMSRAWTTWAEGTGHPRMRDPGAYLSRADHDAFDAWLATAPPQLAVPAPRDDQWCARTERSGAC